MGTLFFGATSNAAQPIIFLHDHTISTTEESDSKVSAEENLATGERLFRVVESIQEYDEVQILLEKAVQQKSDKAVRAWAFVRLAMLYKFGRERAEEKVEEYMKRAHEIAFETPALLEILEIVKLFGFEEVPAKAVFHRKRIIRYDRSDTSVSARDDRDIKGSITLFGAIKRGYLNVIEVLLKQGSSLGIINRAGESPLYRAVCEGNNAVVELLLTYGASPNCRNGEKKKTALHCAAEHGRAEIIKSLLAFGSDIHAKDSFGSTALMYAIIKNHEGVGGELLSHGAYVNEYDEKGLMPIHHAALHGYASLVMLLVEKGAKLEQRDLQGKTAFHYVAQSGQKEVLDVLVTHKVDSDVLDLHGRSALHEAAMSGQIGIVSCLIELGNRINATDCFGRTALHEAAIGGKSEMIGLLVAMGAAVDAQDTDGFSPLYFAIMKEHSSSIAELINAKADVNLRGPLGQTPLHCAVILGFSKAVELLLANGAKSQTLCDYGTGAFDWVLWKNNKSVLEEFVKAGLCQERRYTIAELSLYERIIDALVAYEETIDPPDAEGTTPLWRSVKRGSADVCSFLIQHGANKHHLGKGGVTLLHVAASNNDVASCVVLLDNALDLNARDSLGCTALHKAAINNSCAAIELLIDSGAKVGACDEKKMTPLQRSALYPGNAEACRVLIQHSLFVPGYKHLIPFNSSGKNLCMSSMRLCFSMKDVKKETDRHPAASLIRPDQGRERIITALWCLSRIPELKDLAYFILTKNESLATEIFLILRPRILQEAKGNDLSEALRKIPTEFHALIVKRVYKYTIEKMRKQLKGIKMLANNPELALILSANALEHVYGAEILKNVIKCLGVSE